MNRIALLLIKQWHKNILRMKTTIIDRKQYYQNATSEGIKTFISSHITSIVSELVKQGIPEKHDASTRDDAYDDAYWYNKAIQDTLSNFKKLGVEIE